MDVDFRRINVIRKEQARGSDGATAPGRNLTRNQTEQGTHDLPSKTVPGTL